MSQALYDRIGIGYSKYADRMDESQGESTMRSDSPEVF